MTYRNIVLIYNPRAGKFGRNGSALLTRSIEILKKAGSDVAVAPTTGPHTAGAIAREYIAQGADLVIVAGGDGTINEAAAGMMHSETPLAILPAGTANVLAMEMKMGKRLERIAEHLGEYMPRRVSVGRITFSSNGISRYFLLMAGVGLDAHIVQNVSAPLKDRTGKFAYWVAGGGILGKDLAQFETEANGQKYPCSFALLSKVRNYGGDFEIARNVTLFDNEFEAVLFEGKTSLGYVKYFAAMAINKLAAMKGVNVLRTAHATLTPTGSAPVYVQVDGESVGQLPAVIEVVPSALTLMAPPKYGGWVKED